MLSRVGAEAFSDGSDSRRFYEDRRGCEAIEEAGRPRPAVAGARLRGATLDRLALATNGVNPLAPQPRLGTIPLVVDSSVGESEIWLMSDQGEILQTIEVTDE